MGKVNVSKEDYAASVPEEDFKGSNDKVFWRGYDGEGTRTLNLL